jgi:Uma2 family endonuclease
MTLRGNPAVKLTYEDYLYLPEDGKRHEIIDGEHYVTPAPSIRHQRLVTRLGRLLDAFAAERGAGLALVAPTDVVLSETDVVQPDLLFVSKARMQRVTDANIRGAPDLVVEVLSAANRRTDEITKRDLYAKYGVSEYWIVDPELETVKVYRLAEKGFERAAELSAERQDALASPLLPGLEIPLAELFG